MIPEKLLKKWFDEYEIKARLIPGIILCLPLFFLGIAVPKEWFSKVSLLVGETVIFIAFCKILMGLAQTAGNKYQDKIKKEWNGLPSTRFLRKEDPKYSLEFKEKVVGKVKELLEINLDIENDLSINTAFSAIKTYLHKYDKDKKWQKFNIEYGFHRNLSGLRLWLISSHMFALILYVSLDYLKFAVLSGAVLVLWGIILMVLLIVSYTSPRSCRINSEHYADSTIMTFYEMPVEKHIAGSVMAKNYKDMET